MSTVIDGVEDMLSMAWGVNDCEARLGTIQMSRVWAMLTPIEGSSAACRVLQNV